MHDNTDHSPEADALANHEVMDAVRRGEVSMQDFFGEVIHSYSRAEALEDSVLVDVSKTNSAKNTATPVWSQALQNRGPEPLALKSSAKSREMASF